MSPEKKPIANPQLVLREEFDDWAILFDPDSGEGYGVNPLGVFIWKCLDGRHTEAGIIERVKQAFDNVPDDAAEHVREFVRCLEERGFAGYEVETGEGTNSAEA